MDTSVKQKNSFWRTSLRLVKNITRDDTIGLAAQTAFYLTLSLFPLLLFLVSAAERMRLTVDERTLSTLFPESVTRLLGGLLDGAPPQAGGLWGLLISVWSGSSALWALMRGVFRAMAAGPGCHNPPFWARAVAVVFLLGFTPVVGLSLLLAVFGEPWLEPLLARIGYAQPWIRGIIPYAGTMAGLFVFVLLLYRFTPGVKRRLRQLWPGALLAAAGWTLSSLLFELYITHFTNFGALYGGLGAFLGLLMWLFMVSVLVLAGAELNAATMGEN